MQVPMLRALLLLASLAFTACTASLERADPASDAPEPRVAPAQALQVPASYARALELWHTPEQINAWIRARFEYDPDRALALSETQRAQKPGPPIYPPEAFFSVPKGVCVDLSRFAVETLRVVAPDLKVTYVMLEFNPAVIQGNVLRRHWVASFERDGAHYFFADSKRPGHIAGPYASTQEYVVDYAAYRGRAIVAFRQLESFARRAKTRATKVPRADS